MTQPLYQSDRFTYADYCTWPEEERWELIDGKAYAMRPPRPAFIGTACWVYVAPFDVRLPDRDEADEAVAAVVQPDIAVICDPVKLDDKGCRGAPDWIIAVLSPATVAKDQIQKRALYERHGVREYWLVHPVD